MNFSTMDELVNFPTAVLISGGLDSAILLADLAKQNFPKVWPLFIRCGLHWETVELLYLKRFLKAIDQPNLGKLQILEMPVADLYKNHWSLSGKDIPDGNTPDEAVFLPGRNVLLTAKSLLWCNLNQVKSLSLAVLGSNPFPDASDSFFSLIEKTVNESISGNVRLFKPYAGLHKTDIIKKGQTFPLEHTFSCINPIRELHCGKCNKCAERMLGFSKAGIKDPTSYA